MAQNVLDHVETHVMDVREDVKIRASMNAWMVVPKVVEIHVYLIAKAVVQKDAKVNARRPALQFAHPHVKVHVKKSVMAHVVPAVRVHVRPHVQVVIVEKLTDLNVDAEVIVQTHVDLTVKIHVEGSALTDVRMDA